VEKEAVNMERDVSRDLAFVKRKMLELGITQRQLGAEAGMYQPRVSALLNHRMYAGPRVAKKMKDAIIRLSVVVEAEAEAEAGAKAPPVLQEGDPVPRVRRL
jgi:hypothetical protein